MSLYLDCEFDGYRGPLLSIALVSDDGDLDSKQSEFYAVLSDQAKDPWVVENVLPILLNKPEPRDVVARKLREFLEVHSDEIVYADHAADLMYLMEMLNEPNGDWQLGAAPWLMLHLIDRSEEFVSALPHNALADARALRRWYVGERMPPRSPITSSGPNPRQPLR